MPSLIIDIQLPKDEYLKVYQSYVRQVRATARNGQTVRFPINVLKPYLTHNGIKGTFCLNFDDQNKLINIELMT